MKKEGYYSSGQFAGMAHVTLRTIRYYDKQGILKPSFVNESGARFYTDEDFARLQQILLLKYLGFSLDDIREMIVDTKDLHYMQNSLNIQLNLVRESKSDTRRLISFMWSAPYVLHKNRPPGFNTLAASRHACVTSLQ